MSQSPIVGMGPRTSAVVACSFVVVGVLRLCTDTLHELNPDYWMPWADSWVRYLIRAPSDATWLGYLNAQWFKVLAVPSGVCLIYLRARYCDSDVAEFRDPAVRGVWVGVFVAGFTLIELEKQFGVVGSSAVLVPGEDPIVNHVAHGVGAAVAWMLAGVLWCRASMA